MLRKRSLIGCAALVIAGCAVFPPLAPSPADQAGLAPDQAAVGAPGDGPASEVKLAQVANDLTVFGYGGAASPEGEKWAFSLRAVQSRGTIRHAQFLISSSVANVTLFGYVDGASITRNLNGVGVANLVGQLTSGEIIRIKVRDRNHRTLPDEFSFTVKNGRSFAGTLYHGGVRILNTRPERSGTRNAPGYTFDPQIGLFISNADLTREKAPPPGNTDPNILQVVRPDPIIDFRKDDRGGYDDEPGADNNVPN